MGGRVPTALANDLADGRRQFEAWRRRRTGGRIPDALWALAVGLVSRHGVSRTAAALGLDYYSLKKRAQEAADPAPARSPTFVELPSPVVVGKQAVVELDDGAGAILRVRLVGYEPAEVAALARRLGSPE
jgi:hypothetical protein